MTRTKRVAAVSVMTLLMLPAFTGIAFAQFSSDDPSVNIEPGGENCNGVIPTPGSENTVKTLTGGSLVPGGTAMFRIAYPVDEDHIGDEWEIVDCVLIGNGDDLKDYEVLDQATFDGVINSTAFELNFTFHIPDDALIGTRICNVAKTTEGPSAPQASNRKAGPACFVIGGAARVEKHDASDPDGDPLAGATFEISDCNNTADDPDLQPIIVSTGGSGIEIEEGDTVQVVADEGYISFNGPAGSTCVVTEVAPPPGYTLPPPGERSLTVTIPLGDDGTVYTFLDPPLEPGIQVTKACSGPAGIGDEVTYTITVTNTGNEDLDNLEVDDSLLGDLSGSFPDTLDVGESVQREFTREVLASDPDPLPNEVTASAEGVETNDRVSDDASCRTDVTHEPGIAVSKQCAGTALVGQEVAYTIQVTNTGDEPLNNVTVVDSLLGDISDLFDDTLGVGDSETEIVTRIVLPGEDPVLNTVTASGTGADSGVTVDDEAGCSSDVLLPGINIVKDGPDLAHVGDEVTYTFVVTNTGEVPLLDVTITDPLCDPGTLSDFSGDGNDNGRLDLSETWTASCTHVVTASDGDPVPNTAVVNGEDRAGNPVSDSDDHLVDIIHPDIRIVKTANPLSGQPGDEVTYTYVVTNTGDTTLFDISVDDDKLGHIGDIPSLEPGESATLTKDTTLPNDAGLLTNVAVAVGTDELGEEVDDDDDAVVTVVLPQPPIRRPEPLPETGADLGILGQAGFLFLAVGFGLLLVSGRTPAPAGVPFLRRLGTPAATSAFVSLLRGARARVRFEGRRRALGRDPDPGPPMRAGP